MAKEENEKEKNKPKPCPKWLNDTAKKDTYLQRLDVEKKEKILQTKT